MAANGTLLGAGGTPPIYALGTPLRGTLYESSAVREIRAQALAIAQSIVAVSNAGRSVAEFQISS